MSGNILDRQRNIPFMASVRAVKDAVPIAEYAGTLTDLDGRGRGRCPVHDGDNPTSFVVFPDGGRFYCHACGESGDVIDLCRAVEGGEPVDAVISLAMRHGVELPAKSEEWREWQRKKYGRGGIADQIEEALMNVRRRRWYRLFIAPELSKIEDAEERRAEGERAWREIRKVVIP